MPNWCYNFLTIKTTDKDLLEGIKKGYDEGKLLSHMVPPPDTDDYKNQGWYDWNVEFWGTKWEAEICGDCFIQIINKGDIYILECSFNTAWSPPTEAIENWFLYEEAPDNCEAIITYNECGMGFCGVYSIKYDDEIDIDEFRYCIEYSYDKESQYKLLDMENHPNKYISDDLYKHMEHEIEHIEEHLAEEENE